MSEQIIRLSPRQTRLLRSWLTEGVVTDRDVQLRFDEYGQGVSVKVGSGTWSPPYGTVVEPT